MTFVSVNLIYGVDVHPLSVNTTWRFPQLALAIENIVGRKISKVQLNADSMGPNSMGTILQVLRIAENDELVAVPANTDGIRHVFRILLVTTVILSIILIKL